MSENTKTLVFISGNNNKKREVEKVLREKKNLSYSFFDYATEENQSLDVRKVCEFKTKKFFNSNLKCCKKTEEEIYICEDTGFGIENEGEHKGIWFPGALVKFYWKSKNPQKICLYNKDSKAKFYMAMTIYTRKNDKTFTKTYFEEIEGTISEEPRGTNGFDFDTIFIPNGQTKTLAEMDENEKDQYNPRIIILQKILKEFGFE